MPLLRNRVAASSSSHRAWCARSCATCCSDRKRKMSERRNSGSATCNNDTSTGRPVRCFHTAYLTPQRERGVASTGTSRRCMVASVVESKMPERAAASEFGVSVDSPSRFSDMGQYQEGEHGDERRRGGGEQQPDQAYRFVPELALQDGKPGRVRRVRDHGESAAGDGARDEGILKFPRKAVDERAEVGERRVVGDGGEAGSDEIHDGRIDVGERRPEPPLLEAAETDESREEEGHQQALAQDQRVLVLRIGRRESEEEQKQPEENHRVVREYDDADKKKQVHGGDVAGQRRAQRRVVVHAAFGLELP